MRWQTEASQIWSSRRLGVNIGSVIPSVRPNVSQHDSRRWPEVYFSEGAVLTLRSFFFPKSTVSVARAILLDKFYCILWFLSRDLAQELPCYAGRCAVTFLCRELVSECGFGCPPSAHAFDFHPLLCAYFYTLLDHLVLLVSLLAIDSSQWPTWTGTHYSTMKHGLYLDRDHQYTFYFPTLDPCMAICTFCSKNTEKISKFAFPFDSSIA